ncbi:alpha-ribazole phosphatase [Fundidesulfovibrio butyratiphilus]
MKRLVHLLRHAATEPETPWRFTGRRHRPLSARGLAQAALWRERLARTAFAGAWCSPQDRARRTAEIVLDGRDRHPVVLDDLAEIDLGEWEGLSVEEVRDRHPGHFEARGRDFAGFRPTGGESFSDLADRAEAALREVLTLARDLPAGPLLVVTHAGFIRALVCRLMGIPLTRVMCLAQDAGCLNIVETGPGPARLVRLNMAPEWESDDDAPPGQTPA